MDATRREIAGALKREQMLALDEKYHACAAAHDLKVAAAAIIDATIATLADQIEKLRAAAGEADSLLPAHPYDYQPMLQGNVASITYSALQARLRSEPVVPTLKALAEDEKIVALRERPKLEQSGEKSVAA